MKTFKILEGNMYNFKKKIEKLQKKVKKIGNGEVSYKIVGKSFVEINDNTYDVVEVEVDGTVAPKINGWEFVAKMNHDLESGNILDIIPTFELEIPSKYRTVNQLCEHCNSNRYRKDTFLLYNSEKKEFIQVGKSCMKDFLGHTSPLEIAKYGEMLFQIENEDWENLDSKIYYTKNFLLENWLANTLKVVESVGYTSKAKALEENKMSTSQIVLDSFSEKIEERYFTMAKEVINFIKSYEPKSEYERNLKTLAEEEYIKENFQGYATSMIPFYDRQIELKRKMNNVKSEYYGNEGDKIEIDIVVKKVVVYEGFYGVVKIHLMQDREGRQFVWKTTTKTLAEEQEMRIKATIKEQGEYKDIKQNILTRVKVI